MSNRHFHRRYQSVDMEPMDDSSDSSNQTWLQDGINSMQLRRSEMNELIMDYLVHEGFKEAAERFREEAGIEQVNLRLLSENNSQNTENNNNTTNNANSSDNNNGQEQSGSNSHVNKNNNSIDTSGGGGSSSSSNNNNNNNGTTESSQQQNPQISGTNLDDSGDDRFIAGLGDWPTKFETPEMMDKRIEVRHFIEEGDILKGQSLINLYYPELLDNHRNLYFKLQQQHLIELIRQQKINDVLTYVHEQLSVDELRDLTEMERTLALLAYEDPDKSPYAGLLHTSHRLQLASEINDIIIQETTGNVEPTKPRLVTLLKLLFWTQSELERKKIQFPKMTDLVNGTIVEPRH